MADGFTMFAKFADALVSMPCDQRMELCDAVVMYGYFGAEPDLEYPLSSIFALMKEDIDNSKSARKRGQDGGRPRKKPGVSQTEKPEVSQTEKPEVSEKTEKGESQYKPIQTSTDQDRNPLSGKPDAADAIPYGEIVSILNERTGQHYQQTTEKTRRLIRARWREGFRVPDFAAVVEKKAAAWLGDPDMSRFLRPETLFGTKFEGYLNEPDTAVAACGMAPDYGNPDGGW